MRYYLPKLTLVVNRKGVLDLDTVKGCALGMQAHPGGGCYGCCYAAKTAKLYGMNFSISVSRKADGNELAKIKTKIERSPLPFVRTGNMGDPCHDWEWTAEVAEEIGDIKPFIVITKHWIECPDDILERLGGAGAILNTSISPLDSEAERDHRLAQYNRYKSMGKSILRIVSCDFVESHPIGASLMKVQDNLFQNDKIIDNPLRITKRYPLLLDGIIRAELIPDLNSKSLISRFNPKTYIGKCDDCPDLCGVVL